MTTVLEQTYQGACDTLAEIRGRFHAADYAGQVLLRPELNAAKDAVARLWRQADTAHRTLLAGMPVDIREAPEWGHGAISVSQSAGGQGRCRFVRPGDHDYKQVRSELARRQAMDERVAEAAYAAWGWRGPVRIDYYGSGAEATARVTGGGRHLTMRLLDL